MDRERERFINSNNPEASPVIPLGTEIFGILASMLNSNKPELRIMANSTLNAIQSYVHFASSKEDNIYFEMEKDGSLAVFNNVTGKRLTSQERLGRMFGGLTLVQTKENFVVVGNSTQFDGGQLMTITKEINECDEQVSRVFERPLQRKAILFYDASGMLAGVAGTCKKTSKYILLCPDQEVFRPDGNFNPDARWTIAHEIAHYYADDYMQMYSQSDYEDKLAEVERSLERFKRGQEIGTPDVILNWISQTLENRIIFFLKEENYHSEEIESKAGEILSLLLEGTDLRKVPVLGAYKRFYDWQLVYGEGLAESVGAVVSGRGEVGLLANLSHKFDLDVIKLTSFDLNYLFETVDVVKMAYGLMPAFVHHLHTSYAIPWKNLAEAVGKMTRQSYDINGFCSLLGVNYAEAVQSWQAKLAA